MAASNFIEIKIQKTIIIRACTNVITSLSTIYKHKKQVRLEIDYGE